MNSLRIVLSPGGRTGHTIILAKALVFDDFRSSYGGAELSLVGLLAAGDPEGSGGAPDPGKPPSGRIIALDPADRTRRLLCLADRFVEAVGGYCRLEEALDLLALSLLDRWKEPLAFLAASEQRRRLAGFLRRVEREGYLPADLLSLPVRGEALDPDFPIDARAPSRAGRSRIALR